MIKYFVCLIVGSEMISANLNAQTIDEVNGPLQSKWSASLPENLKVETFVSTQFSIIKLRFADLSRAFRATPSSKDLTEQQDLTRKLFISFSRHVARAAGAIEGERAVVDGLSADCKDQANSILKLNSIMSSKRLGSLPEKSKSSDEELRQIFNILEKEVSTNFPAFSPASE
jgi:hypothetical protein